ncbi:MAG: beta-mannosidase [Armatimonadota bacterium]
MYIQLLDGEWQVSQVHTDGWVKAEVPGSIHVDLMNANVIPDPFYGDNELRTAWVAETDWLYRRTFEIAENVLAQEHILLECDGLDTLATIRLNGEEIAKTDNMFRSYQFYVTGAVIPGMNTVEVEFASPVNFVKPKIGQGNIVSPGDSIPGSPYLRKAMYQWGWDWAPKLPTSGIWRSMRLAGYNMAKFDDIHVTQDHHDGKVTLNVRTGIERFSYGKMIIRAKLTSPNGHVTERDAELGTDDTLFNIDFQIDNPQLWWPNGYGDQPLYDLQVQLLGPDENAEADDYRRMHIGLRTLELRQEPDQWGKTFMFVINGVPIFSKGADWVPADQFPSRITWAHYSELIQHAAAANMNMLRVWGGGLYEDDRFFDLCDQHGILVWQDFMFACGHYPVDREMLDNIALEAKDNIRRIRHHPSLALWCGNNEMEWFLAGGWGSDKNEEMRKEYLEIYYKLLPEVHAVEDPRTPYWPASPASSEPFKDPNGENEGDGHYWDVWHGRLPFTAYRDHYYRLMSEFGFESMPSMDTIKTFACPEDWNMTSFVMENHQKNSAGNGLILYYMAQTFQFPKDFEKMVYVSQLLQAEAMRYGVEHWRRNRNDFRCMGTLYWQYNDCWPVASWASVDYNRRWKALQYFARRFYSPVLLSAEENSTGAKLHVTNDRTEAFHGTVRWWLETLDGTEIQVGEVPADVPAGSDALVADLDFSDLLNFDTKRQTVLVYELYRGEQPLSVGMVSFVPSKHLDLPVANISTTIQESDGCVKVSLTTDKAARYVMLEVPGYAVRFSGNFFDLPAGRAATVTVECMDGLTAGELAERLQVTSLRDSY